MNRYGKWALGFAVLLVIGFIGMYLYQTYWMNPRVVRELYDHPLGERAAKVMLVTFPSGRELPLNYLQKGEMVYAGADGRWWRELREAGQVTLYIKGESYQAQGRAIEDDESYTDRIFAELRPTAPKWVGAVMVEFTISK